MGDGLADEGVGIRHSGAMLGCDQRQVNERSVRTELSFKSCLR
jgi:hypothetical protein